MATIDNLSIQVTASAESAASALDRLASSAGGLRGAATRAGGGLRDLSSGARDAGTATQEAGQQAGNAERHTRDYGRAAQDAGNAAKRGTAGIATFWQALKRIAYYRFIRTVIKSITSAFSEGIKNIYNYSSAINGHFAQSMDKLATSTQYLKNSLGTLVAPLMEALAPALEWLIDRLVEAINFFNMFVAAISGRSTYTAAVKAATSWGKSTSNAASDAANSVKDSVEEMKRTILGFDEINKLDGNKNNGGSSGSGGSGGGGGGSGGASGMFEERTLSGGWQQFSNAFELAVQDSLSRITMIVGAAELAVGAILALSGANIPLGIALIASGAVAIASAIVANWDGISDTIKKVIGVIEGVLAGGLAVGAILAFSGGNVPLGIGLMAAALATGFGSVDILWTTMKDKVGGAVGAVVGIVSAAMIGVGAVLAFSGVAPGLGIGLIAAGVTGVAATLNWEFITGALDTPVKKVIAIVGGASLAIGAILLFSGVAPGVGVAMVAAGATATAATINWNFIKEKLQGPIGQVTALVSGASLMLGILALMAGAEPLGIGLILAGAAGLVSVVAANWDGLVNLGKTAIEKVKEGWETIKELVVKGVVSLVKKVGEWASDAWDLIQSGAQTIAKKVTAAFKAIGEWTGNAWLAIQKGAETIAKKVTGAFETIGEWTGNAWTAIQKGAETIAKKVTGAFETIGEWTGNAWLAIQKGAETIEKKVTAGMEVLQSWADNIVNFILGPDAAEKKANIAMAIENTALAILNFLRDPVASTKDIILFIGAKFAKGLEKFWNLITGQDGQLEVQVDAYGNMMLVPKAGEGLTDNGDGTFSMTNDVEGTTVLSPVKSPQWEQAWKELFGNTPESEVKLNVVKGKIESGVESIVENAGKTIPTTINTALTKASTWVSDAWTALTKGDHTSTTTQQLVKGTGSNWVANAWTAMTKGDHSSKTTQRLVKGTGSNWVANAWTAMTKGDHSSKTTQRLVRGAGANWSANAWTAMTKGDHSSKTTQRLVRGAGANWSENAWTALNANGTHDNTTNQKLKKGSWSDSGYTAMTTTGSHSNTTTQDLKKGNSWSDSAYTAMTKVDHKATITVNLKKGANDTIEIKAESGGGSGGGTWKMSIKKLGGIFSNGVWKGIPQYADGVLGAMHGSMFLAGEAGPELVGHVGGRTEVLNQSQLAATMFSAVRAAMGGVRIAATMYDGSNAEDDYEMMYRAMYDAFTDAMAPNNARDQEKMQLMREIAAKEFTAEVTANSINRAQQRMNRRAGTTIVPVTT